MMSIYLNYMKKLMPSKKRPGRPNRCLQPRKRFIPSDRKTYRKVKCYANQRENCQYAIDP